MSRADSSTRTPRRLDRIPSDPAWLTESQTTDPASAADCRGCRLNWRTSTGGSPTWSLLTPLPPTALTLRAYEGRIEDHEAATGEGFFDAGDGCDDAAAKEVRALTS